jgi:ribosomal protein S18 acetylase RimI-like enzyme
VRGSFPSFNDRLFNSSGPARGDIVSTAMPPLPFQVLPAESADLAPLLSLVHRAYAANKALGFNFYGTRETIEDIRKDFEAGAVWKLVEGTRLSGTIRLQEYPDQPGVLYINRMCVEPGIQKRGLGKSMVEFAESEARRRGLRGLRLDTAKPFERLVGWYLKLGFEIIGETQWDVTNYRSVIMEKRL